MRHQKLVMMLPRVGKRRHLVPMTVGPPYFALCGKSMNPDRVPIPENFYPDCRACAALL